MLNTECSTGVSVTHVSAGTCHSEKSMTITGLIDRGLHCYKFKTDISCACGPQASRHHFADAQVGNLRVICTFSFAEAGAPVIVGDRNTVQKKNFQKE